MEEALITILLADPGVAELAAARVYPGGRPPGLAPPAVVLQRISGGPVYADDGEIGLEKARIQIDCWAQGYAGAKLLARAVTAVLSGFGGAVGATDFHTAALGARV